MTLEFDITNLPVESSQKELAPRNSCQKYVIENGNKATILEKDKFDEYTRKKCFLDGPYIDEFGDRTGEPYNPHRQLFGKLKSGLVVYCELSDTMQLKTKELFAQLKKSPNPSDFFKS